jgi:hypothetical protein
VSFATLDHSRVGSINPNYQNIGFWQIKGKATS